MPIDPSRIVQGFSDALHAALALMHRDAGGVPGWLPLLVALWCGGWILALVHKTLNTADRILSWRPSFSRSQGTDRACPGPSPPHSHTRTAPGNPNGA